MNADRILTSQACPTNESPCPPLVGILCGLLLIRRSTRNNAVGDRPWLLGRQGSSGRPADTFPCETTMATPPKGGRRKASGLQRRAATTPVQRVMRPSRWCAEPGQRGRRKRSGASGSRAAGRWDTLRDAVLGHWSFLESNGQIPGNGVAQSHRPKLAAFREQGGWSAEIRSVSVP